MPFVPPPDGGRLHLSQATLVPPTPSASCGRTLLFARAGEHGAEVAVASLRGDGRGAECVGLDLIFDEYTEFRVGVGGGAAPPAGGGGGAAAATATLPCIHLTGYHLPDFGDDTGSSDGDEEASDDEEMLASSDDEDAPLAVPIDASTDDEEDDSEADDSDALSDSEEEEEQAAARQAQGVVIEELLNDDGPKAKTLPPAAGSEDESEDESDDESGESSGSDVSSDGEDDGAASDDEPDAEPPVSAPEWGAEGATAAGKRKAGDAGAPPAKKGAAATASAAAAPATPAPAPTKQAAKPPPPKQDPASKVRRYDNGFVVEELAPGRPAGKRVTPGARVDVRYTGKLAKTGKVFDSTKGASTFTFRCGVGEVIKAWDRGVAGAVEGAKLRITAPPAMAYGASGVRGAIPGNAMLVFDVEVVRVR